MVWLPDKYDVSKTHLLSSKVQQRDKKTICELLDKLLATKIKLHRATKYIDSLRLMIERGWIPTYHDIGEAELYRCLTEIEHNENLGIWAKRDFKLSLKLILKELNNPLADIIKPNKDRGKQQLPQQYLTVHDILTMVKSDWPHLRDKVMIACLYESGCRPHEFFKATRKDIKFEIAPAKIWDGNGGQIKVDIEIATLFVSPEAKTGARPVSLVFTVPWLKAWLRQSGNQDYVWTKMRGANTDKAIEYSEARKALKQVAKCAGVPLEKAHFYAERHGMATEMSRCMTSAQLSQFAGWVQGSRMPRTYIHLSGKDVIAPRMASFGIVVEQTHSDREAWLKIMRIGQQHLKSIYQQSNSQSPPTR